MRWSAAPRRDERGSVSLELVVLLPVVMLLVGAMLLGYRLWSARVQVTDAAAAAARAATLTSSGSEAQAAAHRVARENLATLGLRCSSVDVAVDTSDFALPPGEVGRVTTRVDCAVALDDLLVPGLPGSRTLHGTATHTMDTFRERRP